MSEQSPMMSDGTHISLELKDFYELKKREEECDKWKALYYNEINFSGELLKQIIALEKQLSNDELSLRKRVVSAIDRMKYAALLEKEIGGRYNFAYNILKQIYDDQGDCKAV